MCVWRRVRLRTSLSQPGPTRRFVEFQQFTCGGQVFVLCTPLCGGTGLECTLDRDYPPHVSCIPFTAENRLWGSPASSCRTLHNRRSHLELQIWLTKGPRGGGAIEHCQTQSCQGCLRAVHARAACALVRARARRDDATPPRAHARNSRRCAELLHAHMRARATGRRASDGEEQLSLRSATP